MEKPWVHPAQNHTRRFLIPLLSVHHFHFETINYNMHSVRAFFPMVFFHSSIESISIGSLTCQPEEIMPILTSFSFTDQTLSTKFHHEQGPFCLKLESFCNWNTFLVLGSRFRIWKASSSHRNVSLSRACTWWLHFPCLDPKLSRAKFGPSIRPSVFGAGSVWNFNFPQTCTASVQDTVRCVCVSLFVCKSTVRKPSNFHRWPHHQPRESACNRVMWRKVPWGSWAGYVYVRLKKIFIKKIVFMLILTVYMNLLSSI